MLRDNRLLVATLGLVAAGTVGVAFTIWPEPVRLDLYHYEDARRDGYKAGGETCEQSSLATIRDRRKALTARETCEKQAEEQRLSTNDLIQQTRAADAAQAQAVIAAQNLRMTFFQTLGGFVTLAAAIAAAVYAREAARQGKNSAKTAERAVFQAEKSGDHALKIAHEANQIARETERAWIVITGITGGVWRGRMENEPPVENGSAFTMHWKNVGKTPALKFDAGTDIKTVPIGSPAPVFTPTVFGDSLKAIGPEQPFHSVERVLDDHETSNFREGVVDIYVYGLCRYRDISGTIVGVTEVCAKVITHGAEEGPGQIRIAGFTMQPIGPQNELS